MSGEKQYTEREMIQAQRAAFNKAVELLFCGLRHLCCRHIEHLDFRREAEAMYPMPKVTRPRVVSDPHFASMEWRIRDGVVECRDAARGGSFYNDLVFSYPATIKRIEMWADLLARPTEEVEDDESESAARSPETGGGTP